MEPTGVASSQERGLNVSAATEIHILGASDHSAATAIISKLSSRAPSSTREQVSDLRAPTASSTVAPATRDGSTEVYQPTVSSVIKTPFKRPLVGAVTTPRAVQRPSLTVRIATAQTASFGRDPALAAANVEAAE